LDLLTPKQVSKILQCSQALIYRMASDSRLPSVRIPCPGKGTIKSRSIVRFKKKDVMDFIEKFYDATT
jgi:excisionase family DNA binding protein